MNKFIGGSLITSNIYRTQAYDSVMCRYSCIGKTLLTFSHKVISKQTKKNDEIIVNFLKNR